MSVSTHRDDTLSFDRYTVIEDDTVTATPVEDICWDHYVVRDALGNCPDCWKATVAAWSALPTWDDTDTEGEDNAA